MPTKKKSKKKGDILARMSVEQRRQYLERRAAQEQEKTRRREELLAGFLKLKLDDEQKKASMNESKLNVKWRSILRQAKTESLTFQLKNLKLWIQETVTSQDNLIQVLINSLDEAKQQRTNSSQKHLSFIHTLAALHEEHISLLTKDFRKREFRLIEATASDIQGAARRHLYQIKRLELVDQAGNELTDREEEKASVTFQNAVASIKTKLEEEAALAAAEEEEQLQDAWWRLVTTLKEFEEETNDLRKECEFLQEKVEANMATKEKIDQEIKDMQAEISMWKSRFKEALNGPSSGEDTTTDSALQLLRNSLITQKLRFREAIKMSNRIANSAFTRLSETNHLGEEILHLADLCRRLETSEDKNLPYRPALPPPVILSSVSPKENVGIGVPTEGNDVVSLIQTTPAWKQPPESDSGIGSSLKTSSSFVNVIEERELFIATKDKLQVGKEEIGTDIKSHSFPPISENPLEQLPKVTLERIQTLLKDEALLKEVSGPSKGTHQQGSQPPSDYIMKETELLLRTHDSLSHFWYKLNNVQVQRLSLKKEAEDLQRENKRLKDTLRDYLLSQGITDKGFTLPKTPLTVSLLPIIKGERRMSKAVDEETKPDDEGKRKGNSKTRRVTPVIEGNPVVKSMEMHYRPKVEGPSFHTNYFL